MMNNTPLDLQAIRQIAEKHCIEREEFAALECDIESLLAVQQEEVEELIALIPHEQQAEFVRHYEQFSNTCMDSGSISETRSIKHLFYLFGLLGTSLALYLLSQ